MITLDIFEEFVALTRAYVAGLRELEKKSPEVADLLLRGGIDKVEKDVDVAVKAVQEHIHESSN